MKENYYVKVVFKTAGEFFLVKTCTSRSTEYSFSVDKSEVAQFASKEECEESIKEFFSIRPAIREDIERMEVIVW